MNAYEKEKKKILILLGVGLFLNVCFFVNYPAALGGIFNLQGLIFITVITLYPTGIVYGWREMIGIGTPPPKEQMEPGRYYTKQERLLFKNGNLMSVVFSLALMVIIGWIPGVLKAYKTLKSLKVEAEQ